jgi:hypothetical protein
MKGFGNEDKTVGAIYETMDYDKFKDSHLQPISRNSKTNKDLMKSLRETKGNRAHPILVDKLFNIVDGHTRKELLMGLGLPITYIVGDIRPNMICSLSSTSKAWNVKDYVESRAQEGNIMYTQLLDYSHRKGVSLGFIQSCSSALTTANIKNNKVGKIDFREIGKVITTYNIVKAAYGSRCTLKNRLASMLRGLANEMSHEAIRDNLIVGSGNGYTEQQVRDAIKNSFLKGV